MAAEPRGPRPVLHRLLSSRLAMVRRSGSGSHLAGIAPVAQHGWDLPVAAMFLLPVSLSCLLGVLAVDAWRGSALSQGAARLPMVNPDETSALTPAGADGGFCQ